MVLWEVFVFRKAVPLNYKSIWPRTAPLAAVPKFRPLVQAGTARFESPIGLLQANEESALVFCSVYLKFVSKMDIKGILIGLRGRKSFSKRLEIGNFRPMSRSKISNIYPPVGLKKERIWENKREWERMRENRREWGRTRENKTAKERKSNNKGGERKLFVISTLSTWHSWKVLSPKIARNVKFWTSKVVEYKSFQSDAYHVTLHCETEHSVLSLGWNKLQLPFNEVQVKWWNH